MTKRCDSAFTLSGANRCRLKAIEPGAVGGAHYISRWTQSIPKQLSVFSPAESRRAIGRDDLPAHLRISACHGGFALEDEGDRAAAGGEASSLSEYRSVRAA